MYKSQPLIASNDLIENKFSADGRYKIDKCALEAYKTLQNLIKLIRK